MGRQKIKWYVLEIPLMATTLNLRTHNFTIHGSVALLQKSFIQVRIWILNLKSLRSYSELQMRKNWRMSSPQYWPIIFFEIFQS